MLRPESFIRVAPSHPSSARAITSMFRNFDIGCPIALGSGCDFSQSTRAATLGSIPVLTHHAASSPQRWTSRWCPRQSGTVNSSLTLRPSAADCAKRRWWASAGRRPHTKHGCLATDLTCSRSRMRRGVGRLNTALSTTLRLRLLARFADGPAAVSLASLDSCTWKAFSTRSASAGSRVFFAASA